MVCIAELGEYTSTDSFKYCSRVIHSVFSPFLFLHYIFR